jgi:hypothetical protein
MIGSPEADVMKTIKAVGNGHGGCSQVPHRVAPNASASAARARDARDCRVTALLVAEMAPAVLTQF